MVFREQDLTSTVDWDNVVENKVTIITGKGQMVYWKGCNVSVIEKDDGGNEQTRALRKIPDGQGIVEEGTKLYITYGKVHEE